jgi:RNA polymerase sigma-70 factor, ECF subfamily
LEVDLLDRVLNLAEMLMITYELESTGFQRAASSAATSNARRVFNLRNRNVRSLSRRPADPELPKPVQRHLDERQREVFQNMFETSRPKFLAIARRIVRNIEDAEDAVQNAYLSGYLNLRDFEGRAALTTWFTRIVINAALMIQRKRRPSRVVSFPDASSSHESDWTDRIATPQPDPEVAHGEQETFRLINERLGNMKPSLRQAFIMTHFEELSIQEACTLLGVPMATFKARLMRARRQLARKLPRVTVAPIYRRKLATGSFRPTFT